MIRLKIYPVDDILPLITEGGTATLDGETVKVGTLRMMTFKTKGLVCVGCGAVGSLFAMEKDRKAPCYHLNLYAIVDGREVLMTHDHILARADGGKEHLSNTQTMCAPCNVRKGSMVQPGGSGVSKSSLMMLADLMPSSARKNVRSLISGIGDDDTIKKLLMDFLLSMRKTCCPSLPTHALPSVPGEISLEEFDTHHKTFIPVGEKIVIVPSEGGFYIYHRGSRERLYISVKGM